MMNETNLGLWFVVILISGVLFTVASGVMQVCLPATRWKKWFVNYTSNLGALSIILNTFLVWREHNTAVKYLPGVPFPIIAIIVPLFMIGVIGVSFRRTTDWVHRRVPGVEFPQAFGSRNNAAKEMIDKDQKL